MTYNIDDNIHNTHRIMQRMQTITYYVSYVMSGPAQHGMTCPGVAGVPVDTLGPGLDRLPAPFYAFL